MKLIIFFILTFFVQIIFGQSNDADTKQKIDSLVQLSRTLTGQSQFEAALETISKAETEAREKLGSETVEYGNACFNYGRVYYFIGNYNESEYWYLKSKSVRETVLGKKDQDYVSSLFMLGTLYSTMGQNGLAENYFLEAKAIIVTEFGTSHPFYSMILNNLGVMYFDMGQLEKAELIHTEDVAIKIEVFGTSHSEYATGICNLANIYLQLNKCEKAEKLYLEALPIWKMNGAETSPGFAITLQNLSALYYMMGNFEKAEQYSLDCQTIREKTIGRDHPDFAQSLFNLANLYRSFGEIQKIEVLIEEALGIQESATGKESPVYAKFLTGLGLNNIEMRKYELAEIHLLEALESTEKTLGKQHEQYGRCLGYLALDYLESGEYSKAEPLFLEALSIVEKSLGKSHNEYTKIQRNLGLLYYRKLDYSKAEALYTDAKNTLERVFGKEYPGYKNCMHDLATVNWQMGRYDESASFLLSARAIEKSMLMDAAGYLSEQELSVLTAQFSSGLNWDFSHAQRNKQISTASYNNILFYKGFLSTTALGINKLAKNDAESSELFDAHKSYRRSLAKEYTKPIEERRNLEELEAKANTVEKELIKHVAGFREASREVFWKDVQDQLHPDEVAIEFVHYISQDITDETSTRYAALVLRPGSAEPTFIDLFEGSEVNDILLETGERRADYINDLYASSNRGLILNGKPKKSMYELIWKPLESNLAGIKTVYYSPSGLLHRINLGAISVNENINLVDQYNLIEVNSTRKLVIPSTVTPISMDAVLFGGINYEPGSEVLALGNAGISPDDLTNRTSLAISSVDSSIQRMAWAPLTWTIPEVESIDKVFRDASFTTVVRRDSEATEESFLTMGQDGSSPCVIHIATHGFFFPDPKSESVASMGIDVSAPVFKRSDNPMIRSGLILAGGNFAWQNGHSIRPDMEDGILTAFEISQMNLYNTELVVLSACETGLGDIQGNEGVYGLQRAFKIAGAKYLIMSLWQVPDRQTMQFMTTFYRHWLEEKLTIPDAFRKTQMEMRDRFFDAYNWAGFVLVE